MAEGETHDKEDFKTVEGAGSPNHESGDQEAVSPLNHKHALLVASCVSELHWLKFVSR